MDLKDAFIESDLRCIHDMQFTYSLEINPVTLTLQHSVLFELLDMLHAYMLHFKHAK